MGVVLVGRVVGVEHLGLRGPQDGLEIVDHRGLGGVADLLARVEELRHEAVLADARRLVLLLAADRHHLLVGAVGIDAGAWTARAVGAGDAGKALARLAIAGQHAMKGHELDIVLVRADRQVGDAREGLGLRLPVGNEETGPLL